MKFEQGDVLKVEGFNTLFLVVSTNFFNLTEQAILCPVVKNSYADPLHIMIKEDEIKGYVLCEQMRLFDLHVRGWKKTGRIKYAQMIDIADTVQSLFDY